jgi:hypothetical protein
LCSWDTKKIGLPNGLYVDETYEKADNYGQCLLVALFFLDRGSVHFLVFLSIWHRIPSSGKQAIATKNSFYAQTKPMEQTMN